MNLFTKRFGLVLAGVIGVGAVASLALGASFALFSAGTATQSNTFTAGTVSLLTKNNQTCSYTNMSPGDTSYIPTSGPNPFAPTADETPCEYEVQYTGTLPAWIGVNITVTSTAGVGGTPLINPSDISALQTDVCLGLSENGGGTANNCQYNSAVVSAAAGQVCTGTGPGESCTFTVPTQIVSYPPNTASGGAIVTVDLNAGLPLLAGDVYQGGSATFEITLVAVQSQNNTNTGGTGPISWS